MENLHSPCADIMEFYSFPKVQFIVKCKTVYEPKVTFLFTSGKNAVMFIAAYGYV